MDNQKDKQADGDLPEVLARQVAQWTHERDRLQGLIDTAMPGAHIAGQSQAALPSQLTDEHVFVLAALHDVESREIRDEDMLSFARAIEHAALAGQSQATRAVPVDQGQVLRTLRSLLDGSQPKDIARSRAEHAGSTPRIAKWDATAADLREALARAPLPAQAGELSRFANGEHAVQAVDVARDAQEAKLGRLQQELAATPLRYSSKRFDLAIEIDKLRAAINSRTNTTGGSDE